MSLSKLVGTSLMLWAGVELSYFIWKSLGSSKVPKISNDFSNTVLFFDSRSPECYMKDHNIDKCERKNCPLRNMRLIEKCLQNAKSTIDVSMYRLSSMSLSSYLVEAIKKGVRVRVFGDSATSDSATVLSLRRAGAFVRLKQYDGSKHREHLLMHHKFVVIDEKLLITGSLNWTNMALSGNWEDAAIILEPSIIKKFHSEFQYLWDNHNTAEELLPVSANPPVFPTDVSFWKENPFNEVFMFRENTAPCRAHMSSLKFESQEESHAPVCAYTVNRNLCEFIESAEKSIDACLLLLNLRDVGNVFLQAYYNDIKVRVITDSHMANLSGSQIRHLIKEGVEVRGRHYHSNMHHKFIILDNKVVLFGSFNWSMQALCGNSENLVFTNNDAIVRKFSDRFAEMWDEFEPVEVEKIGLRKFDLDLVN